MKRRSKKCTPMNRSQMMQAVHSEDTKPEILVRRALFKAGLRYRLHRRDLPGTPDLFILKYGVVVFINGCFWHQHGCKFTSRPKSNSEFWNAKFDNNVVRDVKTNWMKRWRLMPSNICRMSSCSTNDISQSICVNSG